MEIGTRFGVRAEKAEIVPPGKGREVFSCMGTLPLLSGELTPVWELLGSRIHHTP